MTTTTMGTETGCGCGSAASVAGGSTGPVSAGERTRFFPRQLVSAADLTQDQLYFREKSRRHNRMLHGWGIVCGARVKVGDTPGTVVVEAGYVLGPYGDEISIDADVTVDLTTRNLDGDAAVGCQPADPWCADVSVSRPAGTPIYLAVAYAEFACRPVQTSTSACGCGCDDGACEYSRIRDSYRIRVLDTLPATYTATLAPPSVNASVSCPRSTDEKDPTGAQAPCQCPSCSPCPTEPWVILADITMDGSTVSAIDCDAHRRYVASFRDFFYVCGDAGRGVVRGVAGAATELKSVLKSRVLSQLTKARDVTAATLLNRGATDLDIGTVRASSALGKKLAQLSIGDVAGQSRAQFVAAMTAGVSASDEAAAATKAGHVWDQANAASQAAMRYL
jgi:hypothetical protein